MNLFILIIVFTLLFLILSIFIAKYIKTDDIKINNEWYNVYNIHNDAKKAALYLSKINEFNVSFMRYLKNKYLNLSGSDTYLLRRKHAVECLLKYYNPNRISENLPFNMSNTTAFIYNRGQDYKICLRQKDANLNKFHHMDTLLFVNLHELSHLVDVTHNDLFWNTFKFLLYEASIFCDRHIYIRDANYCGLIVHYDPLYDDKLTYYFQ
jgi:hypothetical protein